MVYEHLRHLIMSFANDADPVFNDLSINVVVCKLPYYIL